MDLLISFIFFVTCFKATATTKQVINITIMVPGVNGFKNLAKRVDEIRNCSNEDGSGSRAYENDFGDYEDSSADASSYYKFNGDYVNSDCVSISTKQLNIICIHDVDLYYTYPWSYLFVKPALDIAQKTIENTKGLLDGYQLALHYYDSADKKGKFSWR